jgi:hypothetical protein
MRNPSISLLINPFLKGTRRAVELASSLRCSKLRRSSVAFAGFGGGDWLALVVDGSVSENDIGTLLDLNFMMTDTSLCGLGITAGTAIRSAYDK